MDSPWKAPPDTRKIQQAPCSTDSGGSLAVHEALQTPLGPIGAKGHACRKGGIEADVARPSPRNRGATPGFPGHPSCGMIEPMDTEHDDGRTTTAEGQWGVARFGDDIAEAGRRFWEGLGPSERLDATLQLSLACWALRHANEPPPRLQGSACGVRR